MGLLRKLFGLGRVVRTECSFCERICRIVITRTTDGSETWYCTGCGNQETYEAISY